MHNNKSKKFFCQMWLDRYKTNFVNSMKAAPIGIEIELREKEKVLLMVMITQLAVVSPRNIS